MLLSLGLAIVRNGIHHWKQSPNSSTMGPSTRLSNVGHSALTNGGEITLTPVLATRQLHHSSFIRRVNRLPLSR